MTQTHKINAQTPGPAWVNDNGCVVSGSPDDHRTIAEVFGPNRVDRIPEREANRHLLAASYTSFDSTGRTLGIDASLLAESIDLVALIRAAQDLITYLEEQEAGNHRVHPFAPRVMPLRDVLSKLPKPQTI